MAGNSQEYINSLPEDRKVAVQKLRDVIAKNLPKGYSESTGYPGGIHFTVPHRLYPEGYHCDPTQPLPFVSIISQKNFIAVYHMGIYANEPLKDWFIDEYTKMVPSKLDMGKSCIRLKKMDQIPYTLFAELAKKITPADWIATYESVIKR